MAGAGLVGVASLGVLASPARAARWTLRASVLYLPIVLELLVLDRL